MFLLEMLAVQPIGLAGCLKETGRYFRVGLDRLKFKWKKPFSVTEDGTLPFLQLSKTR